MFHLVVIAALAAAPATTPEAAKQEPVKLASPGFNAVNLDEKLAAFFGDHFAQQLSLQGLRVLTSSEISALVGLERQRQLLGCTESSESCMAELANALGVDALIVGSLAKFDTTYQVNLKIVSASDATPVAVFSGQAEGDKGALKMLNDAARIVSPQIFKKFGREPPPRQPDAPVAAVTDPGPGPGPGVGAKAGAKKWPMVPTVIGGVLVGVGAVTSIASIPLSDEITEADDLSQALDRRDGVHTLFRGGTGAMAAGGVVLLGTAAYYVFFAEPAPGSATVQPQAILTGDGAYVGVSGVLP